MSANDREWPQMTFVYVKLLISFKLSQISAMFVAKTTFSMYDFGNQIIFHISIKDTKILVLGGLGELWTYPSEVIDNDVQDEGWGLFYQYSGAQKIENTILLSLPKMCLSFAHHCKWNQ